MDTFRDEIEESIENRVNGTPIWYVNQALQYQEGDTLTIGEDGMYFGYAQEDPSKRIITRASYQETNLEESSLDKLLLIKVAQGSANSLEPLDKEQLVAVQSYMDAIKFAGTNLQVVSRRPDILIPRLTIYHDGMLEDSVMMARIKEGIYDFILNMGFDSSFRTIEFMNMLLSIDHITDAYEDKDAVPTQGLSLISFDENGDAQSPTEVKRMAYLVSGYMKESSKTGDEANIPDFDDAIVLKIEGSV